MRGKLFLLAGVCAGAITTPAFAQQAAADTVPGEAPIVVTAQRQSQKLQDVPIAVSAFNTQALEKQQIKTTSDLQLSLPNVTFTKTNFTSSSFTIRGIGDLCVGVTCDSATAIHLNDAPLFSTPLFEGEFYDLGQVEVLRGPQGTLFGRNATSGVVNFHTARPDLGKVSAAVEGDYGNYNSKKVKGMINVPLGETVAVRFAGFYLKRDGYTTNLYNSSKIDDRDMYGFRGSLRFEPAAGTSIDLMAQYFHERDNRMRIQKQLCQTDPTGVLGCLNAVRGNGVTNGNSTLASILTSKEFLATQGIPAAFALGSIYGANVYGNALNPADPRQVYTAFTPQYFTDELLFQARFSQDLGNGLNLKLEGNYQKVRVDSEQDYNNAIQDRTGFTPALTALYGAGLGAVPGLPASAFGPISKALIPQGPTGPLCTSAPETSGTGVYGGHSVCSAVPLAFDRSDQADHSWTAEAILSSKWDGGFNFLLGGIYGQYKLTENSYYVDSFGLDYFSGVVGTFSGLGAGLTNGAFLGSPFYRNNTSDFSLKSFGLFGETYFKFSDAAKLTLGLRYNHDAKTVTARTTLWFDTQSPPVGALVPIGGTSITNAVNYAALDFDPGLAGIQPYEIRNVSFSELTGRAVLDVKLSPHNLLYVSYSRGYKSGGINPPLSPIFSVPESFKPEFVNAFEVGSKNTFGALQLNATAFYYKYKDLQLSRIVARTSVNDNVSANIYGAELEAIIRPVRAMTVNVSASYLHTAVADDKYLANPRDFGGGRSDAVIIKDITNAANCAVAPTTAGNAAGANGFVNQVNSLINLGAIPGLKPGAGLQPATAFPAGSGIASTGAYSVCGALSALAPTVGAAFGGISVYSSGIPVNIRGNQLPGAPNYKVAAGAQYEFGNPDGITVTPRFDAILTGTSTGSIFNGNVNRISSYTQFNAQLQLDGPDKKWFIRGYIQNIANSNAVTGLYVTDQSSGNFTNIFTLDPRRYGVAAGFKF